MPTPSAKQLFRWDSTQVVFALHKPSFHLDRIINSVFVYPLALNISSSVSSGCVKSCTFSPGDIHKAKRDQKIEAEFFKFYIGEMI